jgi:hypothetical protein
MVFGIDKVLRIVVEHFRGGVVGRMHVLNIVIRFIPYVVSVGVGGVAGVYRRLDEAFTDSIDDVDIR